MILSKKDSERSARINSPVIKENKNAKLLGINIYNKLAFKNYIESVGRITYYKL